MSKFHENAGQDEHEQMHMLVAKMEGDIAHQMDMSVPSVIVAIQQITASHLAMWDRETAAAMLRETARLLVREINEAEYQERITPLFETLIKEYERQAGVAST